MKFCVFFVSAFVLITACGELKEKVISEEEKLFNSLNSSNTGLTFRNTLTENDSLNYFTYGYMYMGGGVALGDINNDGLTDIYLTGNMVKNKLYLNKGNLKFEDITEKAQVGGGTRWMTGVSMADVNSDGLLDIYVSVSGKSGNKKNILYINKGVQDNIPIFEDQSEEFGVADAGQSTQSTFFDYDLDGDLDLYVANYPITDFKMPNFYYSNEMRVVRMVNSDHFYRNNGNNSFTDVTEESGLLSHGLSLSATAGDFNQDGYPDLYVSNDFASPDYMYLNNGDGTFEEKSQQMTRHTSFYGMGVDIADFNNDGLLDIAQMDMTPEDNRRSKANMASMNPEGFKEMVTLGLHHQYMKNSLQVNNGLNAEGNPVFSDISYLSGIANTDWSWACLFADLDNDGNKDLFITNGSRRDINNKDFFGEIQKARGGSFGEQNKSEINQLKLVDEMPSERIDNYMYKNNGDLTFSTKNKEWGIEFKGFSNGAAYADLDNDGDLELVVNNIDDEISVFENLSSDIKKNNFIRFKLQGSKQNPFGLGTKVTIEHQGVSQYQELTLTRGFQSSVEPIIHFGLGQSDVLEKVTVVWPDGMSQELTSVEVNQLHQLKYEEAVQPKSKEMKSKSLLFTDMTDEAHVDFVHKENNYDDYRREVLLPHQTSKLGPALAVADINNDGLEDFYAGGAMNSTGALFVQNEDGTFEENRQQVFGIDILNEDTGAAFFDANGDGNQDLYVVSGGNEFPADSPSLQDRLYLNDGKGNFSKAADVLPEMYTSGACISPFDYDNDGDIDLFVGGRLLPRKYPMQPRSYILENTKTEKGDIQYMDVTSKMAPELMNPGMVTSAVWTDFNKDDQIDLVVTGEWMPIMIFENAGGELVNKTEDFGMENTTGWWFSLLAQDMDKDGDMDFVAGNLGLNYKYKASHEETFDIYANDFDNNKTLDIVLGYYYDGTQFPVRGRQCSSEQIPGIKKKFENYNTFAEASLEGIYTDNALDMALHYKATTFASSYIENQGNGSFQITPLPNQAQFSSVNGIIANDYNNDGNLDLLIAGNFYVSEIETPRNDAGIGQLMYGDGNGNFEPVPSTQSGFLAPFDTRQMKTINTREGKAVLLANNNDKLRLYRFNNGEKPIALSGH